jgi:flagellar basal-body rod protein FlgG
MNSGIYSAISGNLAAMRRLDVVSNNLANANTAGFKADALGFESILANAKNDPAGPVYSNERFSTDYAAGTLQKSDNVLDVGLNGDGFFTVTTPQGTAYTRQGNFHRGPGNRLMTSDGYEVQSKNGGPITLNGNKIEIDQTGLVTVDGVAAGTIATVDFPKPYVLSKLGNSLYQPNNPQTPVTASTAEIKQGYLETSNVQVVTEMARMIEASRYFDVCSKAVKSFDDMAAKAANDLGKV